MSGVLNGIRVADFCWVGAGSFTTKILADAGADVIKVESRASLDGLRLAAPFAGGERGVDRSGYFADRNSSKRSCTINLKTPEGQQLARRLVSVSDVVTNNFTPGVMDRFGLGWTDVHRLNPAAIYLAMSMQGADGPARDYLGYGITIAALTGLQHLTGLPGRPPIGTNTNYPDHVPNPAHAAFAVLAALRHRRHTGTGQLIEMSQTESTLAVLGPAIAEYTATGHDPQPMGNRHLRHCPHEVYRVRGDDRWVAISVHTDDQWRAVVSVLHLSDMHDWHTARRLAHVEQIDKAVSDAVADLDQHAVVELLLRANVPCAPVQDAAQVVADPQLRYRRHWTRPPHPVMGESLYNEPPYLLSATPTRVRSAAPALGQHTREVCRDLLGLDNREIDRLTEAGVLA